MVDFVITRRIVEDEYATGQLRRRDIVNLSKGQCTEIVQTG